MFTLNLDNSRWYPMSLRTNAKKRKRAPRQQQHQKRKSAKSDQWSDSDNDDASDDNNEEEVEGAVPSQELDVAVNFPWPRFNTMMVVVKNILYL